MLVHLSAIIYHSCSSIIYTFNVRHSDLHTQEGHVLRHLVFRDFSLRRLENVHHFSNLLINFRFNAMKHTRSLATLVSEVSRN